MFKFSFILLISFVLLQGSVGEDDIDGEKVRNLIDKITQALKDLKEKVKKAIENAVSKLSELDLGPELNKFIQQLNNVINNALNAIEDLKENANELGVDVEECTKENSNLIKQTGKDIGQDILKCGTDKIAEAKAIINAAVLEVQNTFQEVDLLFAEFQKCGNDISSINCLTELSAEIVATAAQLPNKITAEFLQGYELITNLKNDLTTCTIQKLNSAVPKIQGVVKTVADCVRHKLTSQ